MQNSTRHLKDQKPRLNPSEHKELVKISGGRTLEILVTKTGSVKAGLVRQTDERISI
jgi:hypothetical protein